jgi:hypothetical protein
VADVVAAVVADVVAFVVAGGVAFGVAVWLDRVAAWLERGGGLAVLRMALVLLADYAFLLWLLFGGGLRALS